ncbi:MAG: cytochrome-c peroxidase [Saprospiraceae bacterium]
MNKIKLILLLGILCFVFACQLNEGRNTLLEIPYAPSPFDIKVPKGFPQMETPEDNPTTEEGIALGRNLFYDPILSVDSSIACSFCHLPEFSFTDRHAKSRGVKGTVVKRSSPSLINVGLLRNGFFWDGRVHSLEEQALLPVEDSLEMQATWPMIEERLRKHDGYPVQFRKAFGISDTSELKKELVVKAISQFERTLLSSGNSKYNRVMNGLDTFTVDEAMGYDIFFDVTPGISDGECGNCHNAPLFTDHTFANNGITYAKTLDDFPDKGLGAISGDKYDNGKFKIPTLYNIALTSPYMHDGRFRTLEQVIDHYNSGGHASPTVNTLIHPLGFSEEDKRQLISFLHTLTDTVFTEDVDLGDPF